MVRKNLERKRKLYRIKRIADQIGSILIGLSLLSLLGLAGSVDAEAMTGIPVEGLVIQIIYTVSIMALAFAAKLLSWYIE